MVDEKKLKGRIVECGFTQGELAEMLKMSPFTLSKKITNKTTFSAQQIEDMCNHLNIADPMPYFFADWLHKCNSMLEAT